MHDGRGCAAVARMHALAATNPENSGISTVASISLGWNVMDDITKRISTSEQMSRAEAFDLAAQFDREPPPEVTQKLFYALDLEGECKWSAIVDYLRNHERPH